jgi:hypothetical protein
MISSLWIAKTGLDAQQTNMDVTSSVWTSGANHRCGGFFHGKCQKLAWRYVVDDTA